MIKQWTVAVEAQVRRVDYQDSLVGAGAEIRIDGARIASKLERRLFAQSWRHVFAIDGRVFAVRVTNDVLGPVASFVSIEHDHAPPNVIPAWSIVLAGIAAAPVALALPSWSAMLALVPALGIIALARRAVARRRKLTQCIGVSLAVLIGTALFFAATRAKG